MSEKFSLHFTHTKGESGDTTNKEDTEKVPDVTEEDLKITVTKVRVRPPQSAAHLSKSTSTLVIYKGHAHFLTMKYAIHIIRLWRPGQSIRTVESWRNEGKDRMV